MKKNGYILLALCLTLSMFLSACSSSSTPSTASTGTSTQTQTSTDANKDSTPAKGSVVLKVAGTVPDIHPITIGLVAYEEKLEELSDGVIDVQVFPNLQLGNNRDIMEGVQLGTIAQCESSLAPFASFNSSFYAFNLPYLFPNRDVAYAFLDGETATEMKDSVIKDGFKILEYFENGFRQTTNSVRAVHTPDDLKGLKIRTMENPVHMETYNVMGALATPMAFGELYTALQQGTVDGQENPYANINSNKLYEAQKYISDTSVFYDVTGFFINPDLFSSLSDDLQSNIKEAAEYGKKINREESIKQDEEYKEFLKTKLEFTELTDAERQQFIDATKPVYEKFRDEIGSDMLDKIMNEIDQINEKLSK